MDEYIERITEKAVKAPKKVEANLLDYAFVAANPEKYFALYEAVDRLFHEFDCNGRVDPTGPFVCDVKDALSAIDGGTKKEK